MCGFALPDEFVEAGGNWRRVDHGLMTALPSLVTIGLVPPRASVHPYLKRLGGRIRQFREAKGWNQEQFAAEAGIDRSYAHGLENGRRNITVLKLSQISKTLGIKINDLFSE